MVDRIGQQLGNYRLMRLLGQGGFAEVYLGEHIYLETAAAIKVLHAQLSYEDAEHFRTEARTIARLVHPHIIRVLEFGMSETTPFLVIDYAPNGTLRARYPRGTILPLSTVVSYVEQLSDALQYAHEQKVIHRDVKPENMLLGRRNEILLSDFGIALVAQSSHYQSTQGIQDIAGTIAYMSPEQIQSHAVPNSDQYALGIVVYEWLSGARPFQGSFAEIAVKHTLVPPPSLRERVPTLSLEVEQVVMRALAKDPQQRFPTIRDFAHALQEASKGSSPKRTTVVESLDTRQEVSGGQVSKEEPSADLLLASPPATPTLSLQEHTPDNVPAHSVDMLVLEGAAIGVTASLSEEEFVTSRLEPVVVEERSSEGKQRVSRRAILLGLAGLGIVGIGSGAFWLAQNYRRQLAVKQTPTALTPQNTLYIYTGHTAPVWAVVWSPDGKYIASAGSDKTVQVWNAANGSLLYTYQGHLDTVYGLSWSPDSKRIASASYDQSVQVWNATSGFFPISYMGHNSWIWSVAWAPNGKYIASAGGDKTVQVWNAADGTNTLVYRGHTQYIHSVAWSRDSRYIASASGDKTVRVWNAANGDTLYTYQPYASSMWSASWSPDETRIASASDNKTIQVWDAFSGNHQYVYYGHTDFVYAVAWSPDGKHIASASDDRTVRIWDADHGDALSIYAGHTDSVRSLSWSPDGTRLASASWDKTVQVWRVL